MKQITEKINEQLRGLKELRLVGENVENGIYSYEQAIEFAHSLNLDLVEVSSSSIPPVCKIIDYQKFLYQKKKKEKERKNKTQISELKELRFSPQIGDNDLKVKINQTRKFLSEGNKVKVVVLFSGREITHLDLGTNTLNKFITEISDICDIEVPIKLEGKKLSVIVKSKKKKS